MRIFSLVCLAGFSVFTSFARAEVSVETFRQELKGHIRALSTAAQQILLLDSQFGVQQLRALRDTSDFKICTGDASKLSASEVEQKCVSVVEPLITMPLIEPRTKRERRQAAMAINTKISAFLAAQTLAPRKELIEAARTAVLTIFSDATNVGKAAKAEIISVAVELCDDDDDVGAAILCLANQQEIFIDPSNPKSYERTVFVEVRAEVEKETLSVLEQISKYEDPTTL